MLDLHALEERLLQVMFLLLLDAMLQKPCSLDPTKASSINCRHAFTSIGITISSRYQPMSLHDTPGSLLERLPHARGYVERYGSMGPPEMRALV
jgi:hypothetical protein